MCVSDLSVEMKAKCMQLKGNEYYSTLVSMIFQGKNHGNFSYMVCEWNTLVQDINNLELLYFKINLRSTEMNVSIQPSMHCCILVLYLGYLHKQLIYTAVGKIRPVVFKRFELKNF